MDWGRLKAGVQCGSEVREPGWRGTWREVGLRRPEDEKGVAGLRDSLGREGRRHRIETHFQAFNLGEVSHPTVSIGEEVFAQLRCVSPQGGAHNLSLHLQLFYLKGEDVWIITRSQNQ